MQKQNEMIASLTAQKQEAVTNTNKTEVADV